jgi:hypothetical protein
VEVVMPIVYIALYERLIGKRAGYIIWDDFTEIKHYKLFDSFRLMKKYAKKCGYYVRNSYSQPKVFFNGIEVQIWKNTKICELLKNNA